MTKEPLKVLGDECLQFIDKPIGFCSKGVPESQTKSFRYSIKFNSNWDSLDGDFYDSCEVVKFNHDRSKRIVGLVDRKFSDGGYRVYILGNEAFEANDHNIGFAYNQYASFGTHRLYEPKFEDPRGPWQPKGEFQTALSYEDRPVGFSNYAFCLFNVSNIGLDTLGEFMDYYPLIEQNAAGIGNYQPYCVPERGTITNSKNTTLVFGEETDYNTYGRPHMIEELRNDPLVYLSGNLYEAYNFIFNTNARNLSLQSFQSYAEMASYDFETGAELMTGNGVAVPYNIILTYNELYALNYLDNGTLPPDAFLFPLDWEDLPLYEPEDDIDDGTDDDDDPDNADGFDGEPDPYTDITIGPGRLTNNNYYWLDIGQLQEFINWFWYDVGELNDFDDIINKVKGLYNDLASAVLNIRYMPVDVSWIGGNGDPGAIKVGMIQKDGTYPTIAKAMPRAQEIGHVKVPKKYKSFMSYAPYAQCSLYLPYYGFLEIDMTMFTGHDIYVYAVYDHLTGTIQYLIYYDNKYLVNSMVCKMAVDIPITLQSKSDRDSAIFQNVSNAMAGLAGAGLSVASGNPIGLLGIGQAINAGQQSAPLSVRGTIGEQGAFYAPSRCKLITSFPSQQKPSNFDRICGKQVNKAYTLSKLSGYTECYNPRITFSKTVPLHEEEEEIYNYLEKGVIL